MLQRFAAERPPSSSHGDEGMFSTKWNHARLVAAAPVLGWILAAPNLGELSPKLFEGCWRSGEPTP